MLPHTLKRPSSASIWATVVLLVAACTQPRDYTQKEAEELAIPVLREYSAQEAIPFEKLLHVRTKYNKEVGVWEVYFESATKPGHEVNILVDRYGNAELSRRVKEG